MGKDPVIVGYDVQSPWSGVYEVSAVSVKASVVFYKSLEIQVQIEFLVKASVLFYKSLEIQVQIAFAVMVTAVIEMLDINYVE